MPTIFLDRDGTINEDTGYLSDPSDLRLIPGVTEALRKLQCAGYSLVVVTNQSGIARGYFTENDLARVHERLAEMLRLDGVILADIRYCPHYEKGTVDLYSKTCDCRKPGTGMLEPVDGKTENCVMIGDKRSDILAGIAAGYRTVLVRTGEGRITENKLCGTVPGYIANDLPEAAEFILNNKFFV